MKKCHSKFKPEKIPRNQASILLSDVVVHYNFEKNKNIKKKKFVPEIQT